MSSHFRQESAAASGSTEKKSLEILSATGFHSSKEKFRPRGLFKGRNRGRSFWTHFFFESESRWSFFEPRETTTQIVDMWLIRKTGKFSERPISVTNSKKPISSSESILII